MHGTNYGRKKDENVLSNVCVTSFTVTAVCVCACTGCLFNSRLFQCVHVCMGGYVSEV